jgi:anti-anti-sigma factor
MGQPTRVAVEGELGIFTAAAVREQLLDSLAAGADVEVDLSRVAEIDSAGVQLMLAAHKEAAAQGKRLRFVACSPAVREIVALCGLADCAAEAGSTGENS